MKGNDDRLARVPVLVLLVLGMCFALQFVPDRMWPHKLFGAVFKRPDMTSMFAGDGQEPSDSFPDSSSDGFDDDEGDATEASTAPGQAAAPASVYASGAKVNADSARIAASDTSYNGTSIEDYSVGHRALGRFFAKLSDVNRLGRPVHIAFMGDSFIEADILVDEFRSGMQGRYGGGGPGFIPMDSNVEQYRSTARTGGGGWKTYSILGDACLSYTLPFTYFTAADESPTFQATPTKRFKELWKRSGLNVISEGANPYDVVLTTGGKDSLKLVVTPPAEGGMTSAHIADSLGAFGLRFANADGTRFFGITLDERAGVAVDNYSLRGNTGLVLQSLDEQESLALNKIRPYDLIILEYGLNVVSDSVRTYGWYAKGMMKSVARLRQCFPDADILILGVSDRGHKGENGLETMPAVPALAAAQRRCARESGVAYWDVYTAMGGRGSMIKWTGYGWAAEDYTHIGFKGGRKLADKLLDALEHEKTKFYGTGK